MSLGNAVAPEVVLVLDEERLRIIEAADAGWGYSRDELLAMDAFALFPRWWKAGKNVASEQTTVTLVRHKSGREALVEIRFSRTTNMT